MRLTKSTSYGTGRRSFGIVAAAVALGAFSGGASASPSTTRGDASRPVANRSARTPLAFEANRGQTDASVRFLTRSRGMTAFFTPTETVLSLVATPAAANGAAANAIDPTPAAAGETVRMTFVGANPSPSIEGAQALSGKTNYFIGSDESKWIADVPNFENVVERGVYPGVDVRWHGDAQGRLTYDLVVARGADVAVVALAFEGARDLRVADDGSLIAKTEIGELCQTKPVAYQMIDGGRRPVDAAFALTADGAVRFDVGRHDATRALVVDPSLTYSTYLGGNSTDDVMAIAVDANGAAYVAGATWSTDFPTKSPFQAANAGGNGDACVTKISADGRSMLYSTYLGGNAGDIAFGIAIDASGAAYVTGQTSSTNFPTQSPIQSGLLGTLNAFVAKLSPSGATLSWSTYLGGTGGDVGMGVAVDASSAAYVIGRTTSTNFPTTATALQAALAGSGDAFVAKISASGSALVYSTYLGGSANELAAGIAVDASGAAYVCGTTQSTNFPTASPLQASNAGNQNAFVAKINAAGSALVYSTYLGGSGSDLAHSIAIDASGAAYVAGSASSANFPTTAGAFQGVSSGGGDAFVAKISAAGGSLVYSTYLGGSSGDSAIGVAVDAYGRAVVAGNTTSADFPLAHAVQSSYPGGIDTTFVTKFNAAGSSILFSTYLGGVSAPGQYGAAQCFCLALDARGDGYVGGRTTLADFPVASPMQRYFSGGYSDAFVTKYPLSQFTH